MWPISYFVAWLLKLCGYSAPYKRFAGVKRKPKQNDDRWTIQSTSDVAHFTVFLSFFIVISIWMTSPRTYKTVPLWIILMTLVAVGMRVGGRPDRAKLKEYSDSEYRKWLDDFKEQQLLEQCRLRRERREAIRAGQIEDDGLSDWGRALAVNPGLSATVCRQEEICRQEGIAAMNMAPREEKIFDIEDRDKIIEATWKRKVAANAAWEKILAKGGL